MKRVYKAVPFCILSLAMLSPLAASAQDATPTTEQIIQGLKPKTPGIKTRGFKIVEPEKEAAGAAATALPASVEPGGGEVQSTTPATPSATVEASGTAPSSETRKKKAAPSGLASMNFQVQFEFGSAALTPDAKQVLDRLGEALSSNDLSTYRFRVAGHTDAVGTQEANLELSKARAEAVRDYLVEKYGISPARLDSIGFGKTHLLDPTNPRAGVNRRVQIINMGGTGG